jgi:hypothetical protein
LIRANYLRICAVFGAAIALGVLSALLATNAQAIAGCDGPGGCPPRVTLTVPSNGATDVDRDRNVAAQFWSDSGAMMESTINVQTVKLYKGKLTRDQLNPSCGTSACPPPLPVSATVTYSAEKKRAILNPEVRLAKRTNYTALVEGAGDSDSLTVKDFNNASLASDVIWRFKTGLR